MSKPYKITIVNEKTGKHFIFKANADLPSEGPGESGSILAEAISAGLNDFEIPHDCGGHLSCCSCAGKVTYGKLKNLTPREEELDMLDLLKDPSNKRLLCQACPDGSSDITAVIPQDNELK